MKQHLTRNAISMSRRTFGRLLEWFLTIAVGISLLSMYLVFRELTGIRLPPIVAMAVAGLGAYLILPPFFARFHALRIRHLIGEGNEMAWKDILSLSKTSIREGWDHNMSSNLKTMSIDAMDKQLDLSLQHALSDLNQDWPQNAKGVLSDTGDTSHSLSKLNKIASKYSTNMFPVPGYDGLYELIFYDENHNSQLSIEYDRDGLGAIRLQRVFKFGHQESMGDAFKFEILDSILRGDYHFKSTRSIFGMPKLSCFVSTSEGLVKAKGRPSLYPQGAHEKPTFATS